MSLHAGIDTVAIVSGGCFTKTYTSANPANLANLYASRGYYEDAPNLAIKIVTIVMQMLNHFAGGTLL